MRELTLERLEALHMRGMKTALKQQLEDSRWKQIPFEERLVNLIESEENHRESRRLEHRLRRARLRTGARLEELEYKTGRSFDRALLQSLSSCQWIKDRRNAIVTGPTGVGKTFLTTALAHKACQEGFKVKFFRLPRLFGELEISRADGTYKAKLEAIAKLDLIVLDDWLLAPFQDASRRDLLEILDDRYDRKSTVVAAQIPPEHWHEAIAEPTLADAILDRLVHNAYHLKMDGESMRKARGIAQDGTLDQTI